MSYRLRGFGDVLTVQSLYNGTVPITCPSGERPSPIKAFVNTPDEPAYLAASNWHCVNIASEALASGATFEAGLKTWLTSPLAAAAQGIMSIPHFADSPQFIAGMLAPLAALAVGWFMFGRRGR